MSRLGSSSAGWVGHQQPHVPRVRAAWRLRAVGLVVWLQASPPVLGRRVGRDRTRPLLGGSPDTVLERLATLRAPAYEAAADVVVDTDGRTVDEVADAVIAELRAWTG